MTLDLKGIITPVVTVFDEKEDIDEQRFRNLIEHLIGHGVYGIFPCGGQGEGASLAVDEKLRLLDICLDAVDGRVPVLMGGGAITTRQAEELAKGAAKAGADCLTVLTPFYYSPTQDELYRHYCDIIDAADIPVMIYNNPWRTHVTLQPETAARILDYSPNLIGIKDSSGDLALTLKYKRLCGERFRVFIGRDHLIYAALCCGLDGAVAATSNAAIDIAVGIYNEYRAGNFDAAMAYQERLVPLREFFSQGTFPVTVKEAMTLQGLPAGPCRRPVGPLNEEKRAALRSLLEDIGLL